MLLLAVVLCLRLPSLFEPYWYGDEGIYLAVGRAIRAGAHLYSGVHDNKPPFLYLAAALAGGSLFWFKFITLTWSLMTILVFTKLAQKVFTERSGVVKTVVWVFALLTAIPIWEGNIANAELYFLLPTMGAAYLLWNKHPDLKKIWWAGVLLGLAGLFKMPAILEAGVWPVVWLIGHEERRGWWRKSLVLAAGVAVPIGVSILYYAAAGAGKEYFAAAWAQNLPYLSTWKAGGGSGIYSLGGRLAAGVLLMIPLVIKYKSLGRKGGIIAVWGLITLFASLLSGRPYPHYLLQMAGVVALATGLLIRGERAEKAIAGTFGVLIAAAFIAFKFYVYPVTGYYVNYAQWVTGVKTKTEYFGWFNPQVNRNYEIAAEIMAGSTPHDRVFIWGDEPMIYPMAKRLPATKYIVEYHIKDFKGFRETIYSLTEQPPKYIVSFGSEEELPGLAELLGRKYKTEKMVGNAKIFRLSAVVSWER